MPRLLTVVYCLLGLSRGRLHLRRLRKQRPDVGTSFSGGTPCLRCDLDLVELPVLGRGSEQWACRRWRWSTLRSTSDGCEGRDSVISKSWTPWSVATPIVSPTAKCSFSEVLWSIAICPPPTGHLPVVSLSGLKRASFSGSTLAARLEPPCVEMTLPLRPMSFASSPTEPAAAATSGSSRPREDALGKRRRRCSVAVVVLERDLSSDHRVGVLIRTVNHLRERRLDGVRQDVGAADHRDAEDDRQRSQHSGACAQQSFEGYASHCPELLHHRIYLVRRPSRPGP